jgi:hypothetical protein
MDADVSVYWLTLAHALLKEATNVVVLKRRARLMQLRAVWELTGLRPLSDRRVCWIESTVGNLTARDTWHASE